MFENFILGMKRNAQAEKKTFQYFIFLYYVFIYQQVDIEFFLTISFVATTSIDVKYRDTSELYLEF